jgi:hypothetical protein
MQTMENSPLPPGYTAKLVALIQTYLDLRLPLTAALHSALADLDQLA